MKTEKKTNPWWKYLLWGALILLCIAVSLGIFFYLLPLYLPHLAKVAYGVDSATIDKLGQMGDSYGIYNALFSGLAFAGVIITLYMQARDSRKRIVVEQFYKRLDVQQSVIDEINVSQVRRAKKDEKVSVATGRKAFVEFKIQLKYLVKAIRDVNDKGGFELTDIDIADIAYAVFFYGSAKTWKDFMMEYLKDYKEPERLVDAIIERLDKEKNYILNRPNQNYLSVYFRNMYNAIKLIDEASVIGKDEKTEYVKILRSQLSNAELYVLFFNVISRFGKKWIEHDYVTKYQLIQNLPSKYCDGYDPKEYFPNVRYEGDELCLSPFKEQIVQRQ